MFEWAEIDILKEKKMRYVDYDFKKEDNEMKSD